MNAADVRKTAEQKCTKEREALKIDQAKSAPDEPTPDCLITCWLITTVIPPPYRRSAV
jgi:hypothetical protein